MLDMNPPYRTHLIESVQTLIRFHQQLFEAALNLEMSGNLKSIDDTFEVGDTYVFEITQLQASGDNNVQTLLRLHKIVEEAIDSTKNLNALSASDLDLPQDDEL